MSVSTLHRRAEAVAAYVAQQRLAMPGRDAEGSEFCGRAAELAGLDGGGGVRTMADLAAMLRERGMRPASEVMADWLKLSTRPDQAWWLVDQSYVSARGRLVRSASIVRSATPPRAANSQAFVAGPYASQWLAAREAERWADSVVVCETLERFMRVET